MINKMRRRTGYGVSCFLIWIANYQCKAARSGTARLAVFRGRMSLTVRVDRVEVHPAGRLVGLQIDDLAIEHDAGSVGGNEARGTCILAAEKLTDRVSTCRFRGPG